MTSFVHVEHPTTHPGVERIEALLAAAAAFRRSFDGTKRLAYVLLAAMVAALVVVAEQLIDTWADGHLMAAWVLLWLVAFAAMAVLAPTAKHVSLRLLRALDTWSRRLARQRADDRLWDLAQKDPRVMADLRVAIDRAESETAARVVTARDLTASPIQSVAEDQDRQSIRAAATEQKNAILHMTYPLFYS